MLFLNSSTIFILMGIAIVQSTVSTPWTPPAAFHSGAHWRLLIPRKGSINQRSVYSNRKSNICKQNAITCAVKSASSLKLGNANNSIIDKIAQALGLNQAFNQNSPITSTSQSTRPKQNKQGSVIRTAARPHQSSGGSIPSSRHYTTRKSSLAMIGVSDTGVSGDYNHYRTVALQSTANRAISILTRDVSAYISTLDNGYFTKLANGGGGYRDGDLGENVLVGGVDFDFFQVGQRYRFTSSKDGEGDATSASSGGSMEDVIVEITEPMEPCANLCKLPYINDPTISSPKERVAKCQYFIEALGRKDGLRGWYAKVIQGGVIHVGDSLFGLGAVA